MGRWTDRRTDGHRDQLTNGWAHPLIEMLGILKKMGKQNLFLREIMRSDLSSCSTRNYQSFVKRKIFNAKFIFRKLFFSKFIILHQYLIQPPSAWMQGSIARLGGIQVGEVVGGNLPPHTLANPLDIRNRRCVFPQDNLGRPHPSLLRPHPSFLKPHQVS